VDLVVDQVRQLEHVDRADGDVAIERLTGAAVAESDLPDRREAGRVNQLIRAGADLDRTRAATDERGERGTTGGLSA